MSKVESGKRRGEEENELLKDVETINKVPYTEKNSSNNSTSSKSKEKSGLPDPKSKSKASKEDNLRKDKKSIWSWKSLKVLSLSRNRRFNCSFSLQVHLIEGLPLSFNDSCLSVCWKRRDVLLVTPPAKVIQGVAKFQEILTHTCSIYGSKSGPKNSAKYEAKHFLLYVSMVGTPELNLGKHQVDLTRLLPHTLEELEDEKSSGKWTTSFRLSGTAKGAVMNVSFGYVMAGDKGDATRDNHGSHNALTFRQNSMPLMDPDTKPGQVDQCVRRTGSLPSFTTHYDSSQYVDEVKDLHEVLPSSNSALASSVDISFKKIDEEKTCSPQHEHDKPELEVFRKNPAPVKSDACSSSDTEKQRSEENPCDEGKKCIPVHDKPKFDMFLEKVETVKPDSHPLPDSGIENPEECESDRFSVVDQGIKSSNEHVNLEESIVKTVVDAHTVDSGDNLDAADYRESEVVHEFSHKKDSVCAKELLLQELESALNRISELETVAMDSPHSLQMRKSHSLDDITDLFVNDFVGMLGIEHSPMTLSSESETESPRELLLRQFEKEVLSEGFSLFDFYTGNDNEADDIYDSSLGSEQWNTDIKTPSLLPDLQKRHLIECMNLRSKQRAQMLEDLETETLMREWGLNEKAFQHSPPKDYTAFGSPIHLLHEEPLTLPPLAEGIGPFLQTKDGGFLRSMNPLLFRNSKSGGNLIMQVSNPVVIPAEMGSGIMEILQCLASMGIEKLSIQAKKFMPLEDITGKTMQQISWEEKPVLEGTHRQCHLQHDLVTGQDSTCLQRHSRGTLSGELKSDKFNSGSVSHQRGLEFVSLEDLAPLAMDKIEALSLEGLRIQSGMSEEDAPSDIIAQSFGDLALQDKGININGTLGFDGVAALQLLDIKDSSDSLDEIMGLSLTLDEWMRLDSGEIDDIDNISEHTSKLLAAHHANSFDLIRECSKDEKKQGKSSDNKCGLLGNNFTVALMVQLRDPVRNYEPVGTSMLALIQVERLFVTPKQKIHRCVSEVRNHNDEDYECEIQAKVEMKENKENNSKDESIPQFRIAEVHLAGLKTEPHKKKLWGTSSQQQSSFRWLIANGMGKSNKNPLMKSKVPSRSSAPVTTKLQPGDTLWSISSHIYGTGTKLKELVALNPYLRNPNIIIPNKANSTLISEWSKRFSHSL